MQQDDPKTIKDAAPTGTQTLLRGLGVVQAVASGARDLKEIARLIAPPAAPPIAWPVVWWMNVICAWCRKWVTCWGRS